jgi:hypothetical protein
MPPFLRRLSASLALLAALTAAGCGGPTEPAAQAEPCTSPIAVKAPGFPPEIPLEEWGTIVRYEKRAGFIGAEAVSNELIVELYPEIVRTLTGAGYTLLGGDNEGFEAEISFTDPKERYINIILRGGRCQDEILVRVLIEKRTQT